MEIWETGILSFKKFPNRYFYRKCRGAGVNWGDLNTRAGSIMSGRDLPQMIILPRRGGSLPKAKKPQGGGTVTLHQGIAQIGELFESSYASKGNSKFKANTLSPPT